MNVYEAKLPSLAKEGGRHQLNVPKAPYLARTGWFVQATKKFLDQHHPVCAFQRWLRGIFLMAQPPLLSFPQLRRGLRGLILISRLDTIQVRSGILFLT